MLRDGLADHWAEILGLDHEQVMKARRFAQFRNDDCCNIPISLIERSKLHARLENQYLLSFFCPIPQLI